MNICSICFEAIIDKYTLECHHTYDATCILEWWQTHTTCPLCRREIQFDLSKYILQQLNPITIINTDMLNNVNVNVNYFSVKYGTPLWCARLSGKKEIEEQLIQYGATEEYAPWN